MRSIRTRLSAYGIGVTAVATAPLVIAHNVCRHLVSEVRKRFKQFLDSSIIADSIVKALPRFSDGGHKRNCGVALHWFEKVNNCRHDKRSNIGGNQIENNTQCWYLVQVLGKTEKINYELCQEKTQDSDHERKYPPRSSFGPDRFACGKTANAGDN
jgi:hypothetical protein